MRLRPFLWEQLLENVQESHSQKSSEREYELSAIVHDINNTVQDLTLVCDSMIEELQAQSRDEPTSDQDVQLLPRIKRIEGIARTVATVVSDAKRRRELERLDDLTPRELVEITEVVLEVASFARLRAERKRTSVVVQQDEGSAVWVKVSMREHLETILRNLLNNAVTYCPAGSSIEISVRRSSETAVVDVSDNGPGLEEDELHSIFEAGFRGRYSGDASGGLGVGLTESRRVARSAGGDLTVYSQGKGFGCRFSLELPLQEAPASPSRSKSWALLVDDEPQIVGFYAKLAAGLSMSPETATSVPEAISLLESKGKPSFVITDIHLGGSDGLDLVRELRNMFGKGVPILVISGIDEDGIVQRVLDAGASDFISKPVGR